MTHFFTCDSASISSALGKSQKNNVKKTNWLCENANLDLVFYISMLWSCWDISSVSNGPITLKAVL
jgi:hypothetical protein